MKSRQERAREKAIRSFKRTTKIVKYTYADGHEMYCVQSGFLGYTYNFGAYDSLEDAIDRYNDLLERHKRKTVVGKGQIKY